MLSRRALLAGLAGAAAAAAVGVGVEELGTRGRWRDLLPSDAPVPTAAPGPRTSGVFASRACGREVAWCVAYPPGWRVGDALPVALVLHGRGGDERSAFDDLRLDGFLADVVRAGAAPFALAAIDLGDHSYWHRRRDGEDPQAILTEEFLPLLARQGLRTARVAVLGWSMGGYGALLLAETAGPERVAAVAADSPALWRRAADAAAGAFDGAADFAAHDVLAGRDRLAGIPVRVACGDRDPFYDAARAFVRGMPDLAGTGFGSGAHDDADWRSTARAQLCFLAAGLEGALISGVVEAGSDVSRQGMTVARRPVPPKLRR